MPRTQTSWLQDTGLPDAKIPFGPGAMLFTSGTPGTVAFSPTNGLSMNIAAGETAVVSIPMNGQVFRSGVQDDLQQAFGSGGIDPSAVRPTTPLAGSQGLAVPPAIFTTPAGVSGAPPFPGMSQLNPVTVPRGKGLYLQSITLAYTILGGPLTLHNLAVYGFSYPILNPGSSSGFGPNATWLTLLPPGQYNLATAVSAGGGIVTSNIPLAIPVWVTPPHPQIVIQWSVTTGAGTADLYEAIVYATENFN